MKKNRGQNVCLKGKQDRIINVICISVITQTDLPKSVRKRCVIDVFGGIVVLKCYFLNVFVGERTFFIGLSQISLIFSCRLPMHIYAYNVHDNERLHVLISFDYEYVYKV